LQGVLTGDQDRRSIASTAARARAIISLSSASASVGSPPLRMAASRHSAASATPNAPNRACRTLQRMRQRTRVRRKGGERADQPDRLGRKHRQHLALEAGIAKRHAVEVLDIDRTVIGSKRRRWHPVNPFQMKRHGDNPNFPA